MSKAGKIADSVDEILETLPGGQNDVTKKQDNISLLPDVAPLKTDEIAFYNPAARIFGKASIETLGNVLQRPGLGQQVSYEDIDPDLRTSLNYVRPVYPLNGNFTHDIDGDGLADYWFIGKSASVTNITRSIGPYSASGYSSSVQKIEYDTLGNDPDKTIALSQMFRRDFIASFLVLEFYAWLGGDAKPPSITASLYWHPEFSEDPVLLKAHTISEEDLSNNPLVKIHVTGIPDSAKFLTLSFEMAGGADFPVAGRSSFAVAEVTVFTDEMVPPIPDRGINIIADGTTHSDVRTLEFSGSISSQKDTSTVAITIPSVLTVSDGTTEIAYDKFKIFGGVTVSDGRNADAGYGIIEGPRVTPTYVGFLSYPLVISATDNTPRDKAAIWFDNTIIERGATITDDPIYKGIEITPETPGATDLYLIACVIQLDGLAPRDGQVRLYIRDKEGGGEVFIHDVSGHPLAVSRAYTRDDDLGKLFVAGIIAVDQKQEISIHVSHTFVGLISTKEYNAAPSGLVVQNLTGETSGLDVFLRKTGLELKWFTKDFFNPIADLRSVLATDYPVTIIDSPENPAVDTPQIFTEDNFSIVPVSNAMEMYISQRTLHIRGLALDKANKPQNAHAYLIYPILGANVKMLHKHYLSADVMFAANSTAAQVLFLFWQGTGDMPNAITGVEDGGPKLAPGWQFISSADYTPQKQEASVGVGGLVPADAQAIAFVVRNTTLNAAAHLLITDMTINVDSNFRGAYIDKMINADENFQSLRRIQTALQQSSRANEVLRYTINAKESPCPVGVVQRGSQLPVLLDATVNLVPGSQASGGEGAIKFTAPVKDATVELTARVYPGERLAPDAFTSVTFVWYKVAADGTLAPMPDYIPLEIDVTQGKGPVMGTRSFVSSFNTDDRIALRMFTGGNDYAFMQSAGGQHPMISIKIYTELLNA